MRKAGLLFLLFFCLPAYLFSQQRSFSQEVNFSEYLINNREYKDAIYTLNKVRPDLLSRPQLDSLNYFKGWSYYNLKKVDTSAIFLERVSVSSVFYHKSKFYQAFDVAYSGHYAQAREVLDEMRVDPITHPELKKVLNYQKSAIALLTRDYTTFDTLAKQFSYDYFPIAEEEKGFVEDYNKLKKFKDKSPLVAGLMSAVIPGSGKFYTGFKGQGASALLTVSALAAAAAESYIRGGYNSPQFIIFGSVFTIFYVGNIWGSVLSVKIRKDAFYRQVDNDILLDMHIPLRRVFN